MDKILQEEEVSLRRLDKSDIGRLAELANNKKIWDNVRDYFSHPYSVQDAEKFIEMISMEDPPATFGIRFKGELAGVAGLVGQSDVYRLNAEIGYWIGEPFWGKGIASKAVNLLTSYGFEKLGLERIYSGIFDYNKASKRVLEKCGFQFEGVFERAIIKNGQILDEFRYSKLKEDI